MAMDTNVGNDTRLNHEAFMAKREQEREQHEAGDMDRREAKRYAAWQDLRKMLNDPEAGDQVLGFSVMLENEIWLAMSDNLQLVEMTGGKTVSDGKYVFISWKVREGMKLVLFARLITLLKKADTRRPSSGVERVEFVWDVQVKSGEVFVNVWQQW